MPETISKWMRQIIDNSILLADYIQDLDHRSAQATREGVKASKEGNGYLANTYFGRAEAFESLKNSAIINLKESETQDAFQQANQNRVDKRSGKRG